MKSRAVPMLSGALFALAVTAAVAGELEVKVVVADGKPIQSGRLSVRDQTVELKSDGGTFTFKGLPDKRVAAAVEADIDQGKAEGTKRYVGVQSAQLEPARGVVLTVTIQPETDMERFCGGCHPAKGEEIKPGQVVRDLHPSNRELNAKHLAQVKAYNEKAELQQKQKKPNPIRPIPLEERVVVVNGKDVKKQFFTCESCHTVHAKTSWARFARAAFVDSSELCIGCHY